jgi:LemA protein
MSKGLMAVLGFIAVLLILGLMIGGSFIGAQKNFVAKDEAVKAAWSDVDTQLQRRADLIPNLVETVKGFTKEESSVFGEIAQARQGYMNAQTPKEKIAANQQIDQAMSKFLVLVENYPQLKSNEQFLRLQDELAGTENRITVSRRRYNEALREYNTYVRQFPNNIWAGIAGFAPREDAYFQASAASRNAPSVKF